MEKNDIIKVAIVIIVIGIFVVQYAGMGINNDGGSTNPSDQQEEYATGFSVLNATIDYYERSLYVSELDYETMQIVKGKEGVKEVSTEENGYKISLTKKEEVVPLYYELKELGVDSYAIAKVTLQPSVTITDASGNLKTGYFYNRKIKVSGIEPIFPEGSIIQIRSEVVVQEGQAYQTGTMNLYTEARSIDGGALVFGKQHFEEFIISWGKRNDIDLQTLYGQFGEENVSYEKNNQIIFSEPISIEEQLIKKKEYVGYINAELAIINENFTNMEQIKSDFGEATIFLNSTLLVKGEDVNIDFPLKEYEVYYVKVGQIENYVLNEKLTEQKIVHEEPLQLNSTINIRIDALVTGNNIVSIEGITLVT